MGVVVSCFLAILLWTARPLATEQEVMVFRYSATLRIFAMAMTIGCPLAVTAAVFFLPRKEDDTWPILGTYALFAGLSLPLWWETSRFSLTLLPAGFVCQSPWRGRRFMLWNELEEVRFSSMNMWFIAVGRGEKIRISCFVTGISQFLDRCEQYIPSGLAKAKAGYLLLGRAFPGGDRQSGP
jgi:hypothetical protein